MEHGGNPLKSTPVSAHPCERRVDGVRLGCREMIACKSANLGCPGMHGEGEGLKVYFHSTNTL